MAQFWIRKDHLIEALWSSRKIKKFETLKMTQKGDFARHCPTYFEREDVVSLLGLMVIVV